MLLSNHNRIACQLRDAYDEMKVTAARLRWQLSVSPPRSKFVVDLKRKGGVLGSCVRVYCVEWWNAGFDVRVCCIEWWDAGFDVRMCCIEWWSAGWMY